MRTRMALAVLWLFMPGLAWAQSDPENVLPAKSQLYFRWDGAKAHREEFNKTAFGKTLKGDTGRFLVELWDAVTENIQQGLDQFDPNAAGIFKDVTKALTTVADSGVALGVELEKVNPPRFNSVLVFPGTAGEGGTLLGLIQKAADASGAEIKDSKVGRRVVHRLEIENTPLILGWWREGEDSVLTFGSIDPVEYAKDIEAKKTGLAKNPLFQKVAGFKEFTTGSRGFLDMHGLVGVFDDISPEVAKFVDALGVRGLKSATFVSGYEGEAFRDMLEVDIPGPRKGLLALSSNKKFTLKDLPPMPSDLTSFSAASVDVGNAYDVLLSLVDAGVRAFAPDEAAKVQMFLQAAEQQLGVNFKDDIFGCFGDMTVSYSSPAEGPLGLGATTLVKVKNGRKLTQSIETLVKNIPNIPNLEVNLQKNKYRDAELMNLHLKIDTGFTRINVRLGSFGVYNDWFVFSRYPQGVKGFVLRSKGDLPVWKANDELTKIFAKFPKEFTAVEMSDPRSTLQFLWAVTPFIVDTVNQIVSANVPTFRPVELDLVPHAQEATHRLFPRVSVTTDNGGRVRSESRSSLGLP
jgi:hypothetical protein